MTNFIKKKMLVVKMSRQMCEEICNFCKIQVGGEREKKLYGTYQRRWENVIRQWCFLKWIVCSKLL